MTKREEVLTKLLKLTWECLPAVLAEDALIETDVEGLARIADAVGIALNSKRVRWSTFDAHMRSVAAQKGWDTRRAKQAAGPDLRVVR